MDIQQPKPQATYIATTKEGFPLLIPVTEISGNSSSITTIASETFPVRGLDNSIYFRKVTPQIARDNATLQRRQLELLRGIGAPVPSVIAGDETTYITSNSGSTIDTLLRKDSLTENSRKSLHFSVGEILRGLHERLSIAPIAFEDITISYEKTSHPVAFFFYQYLGHEPTLALYQEHELELLRGIHSNAYTANAPLTEEIFSQARGRYIDIPSGTELPVGLTHIIERMNLLADQFAERLKPFIVYATDSVNPLLDIPNTGICYGDYKADNIVAKRKTDDQGWDITLIDPLLSLGRPDFDLIHFTTRYLLNMPEKSERKRLLNFFQGYGKIPTEDIKIHGPFSFADIVLLSMMNLLRNYALMYINGERGYNLLNSFDNQIACEQIFQTINELAHVHTTAELDFFLSGDSLL